MRERNIKKQQLDIQEIVKFLSTNKAYYNKGYLKKGYSFISDKLGISESDIREAVNILRKGIIESSINTETLPVKSLSNIDITIPGTYLVTGCAHAPWQNKKFYESLFNYVSKEIDLKGIILAGDIADANSLSFHDRGNVALPGVTLEYEYKETNKFLNEFDDLHKGNTIYLYGNHEDRYNRLMSTTDVSKYGDALKSPIEGLKLDDRGYKVLTNWKSDYIKIGKHLEINHGEFFNVHSAKKTIDTYRKSVMYFHTHRFQIYMEGKVAGWNMGAGADFNAPVFNYASRAMRTSWVNGCALVTLDKEGFYHVQPLLWMNNSLIINGIKY